MLYQSQQVQVCSLICSLPCLEDLYISVSMAGDLSCGDDTVAYPFTLPPLTGTLKLHQFRGIEHFIPRLSDLLKGIRFRKLEWWGSEWNTQQSAILLDACSSTLEDIDVWLTIGGTLRLRFCCVTGTRLKLVSHPGDPPAASIDLSKATKLKKVSLRSRKSSIVWTTMALNTITLEHKDLQEISIHIRFGSIPSFIRNHANPEQAAGEKVYRWWMDLDHLLVRLCESHGVSVMVKYYYYSNKKEEVLRFVEGALPETMKRESTTLDCALWKKTKQKKR